MMHSLYESGLKKIDKFGLLNLLLMKLLFAVMFIKRFLLSNHILHSLC